jgi:thiamine biosynthesis protein ThiS
MMRYTMHLTINGESREVPGPATLQDLLTHLDLDPRGVVVEHNRTIVRRPQLAEVAVAEGDQVEIVHFVGGG